MYVLQSARYSGRRSLFGALIGAMGGIYVSQVEYACVVGRLEEHTIIQN